ncbi:hypothetical protein VP01_4765g1 [Puccinia sorghi]|uniref:Uncharacterized protein n=1 Tax=Puccinia sorghi TaxID=27349 RepID=A0A0L6UMS3_9BASI|nr:hypothetical protein VP01_4765g1 [Puccinia sorghi]
MSPSRNNSSSPSSSQPRLMVQCGLDFGYACQTVPAELKDLYIQEFLKFEQSSPALETSNQEDKRFSFSHPKTRNHVGSIRKVDKPENQHNFFIHTTIFEQFDENMFNRMGEIQKTTLKTLVNSLVTTVNSLKLEWILLSGKRAQINPWSAHIQTNFDLCGNWLLRKRRHRFS